MTILSFRLSFLAASAAVALSVGSAPVKADCDPLASCPMIPVPVKDKQHIGMLAKELPQIKQMLGQLQQHKQKTGALQQTYGDPGQQQALPPVTMGDSAGYKPTLPTGADAGNATSMIGAASSIDAALFATRTAPPAIQDKVAQQRQSTLDRTVTEAYALALTRRNQIAVAGTDAGDLVKSAGTAMNLRNDVAANTRARALVAQSADTLSELMNVYMQLQATARLQDVPVDSTTVQALPTATGGTSSAAFDAAKLASLGDTASGRLTNSVFNAVASHNQRSAVLQAQDIQAQYESDIVKPWENAVGNIAASDQAALKRLGEVYQDPTAVWTKLRGSLYDQIKLWKINFAQVEGLSDQEQFDAAANSALSSWVNSQNETISLGDLAVQSVNANPEAWGKLLPSVKQKLETPVTSTIQNTTGSGDNASTTSQTVTKKPTALDPEKDMVIFTSWVSSVKEERFRQYFVTDDVNPKPVAEVRQVVAALRNSPDLVDPGRAQIDQDLATLQANIASARAVIPAGSKYAGQLAAAEQKYAALIADSGNQVFVDP